MFLPSIIMMATMSTTSACQSFKHGCSNLTCMAAVYSYKSTIHFENLLHYRRGDSCCLIFKLRTNTQLINSFMGTMPVEFNTTSQSISAAIIIVRLLIKLLPNGTPSLQLSAPALVLPLTCHEQVDQHNGDSTKQ